MRIGIDCRLPTYRLGGISQYVLQLMPALAELDGRNEYIAFHSRKEQGDFTPAAENWRRIDLWTPCHHRIERWSLAAELAPHRLDLFHSPDFIPPAWGAKRRIITVHDLNFLYYPQLLTDESRRYYSDQIQWAVNSADAISADSEATRQDILDMLDVSPAKVRAIHLAANPVYARPVAQGDIQETLRRFGLRPGYLLAVGTLEPRKNLPFLLQVYARLCSEQEYGEPLVLVGRKGWLYDEVFAVIKYLNLAERVRHLESVGDESLAHLYHAAGALATPSLYEGFGLPALEAQHCGCPVVVSDRGSLPEIVGAQGYAIPLENEDGWVSALSALLKEGSPREEAIAFGRLQAKTFSWTRTAKQTLELYTGESQQRA